MAKLSKEDIIGSLKEMDVLEINELIKDIEKEFGVSSVLPVSSSNNEQNNKSNEATSSEVSVVIKSVGTQKIAVIKAVQAITGLGLMDSKKIVDNIPAVVKEKISSSEAEEYKKQLVAAGAEVEIK